jgi:pyruvate-formate lyase-activating enzyme
MEVIDDIIVFLKSINFTGPVHLMPYNKLGKTKYEKIGKGDLYQDLGDLTEEKLESIVFRFSSNGFEVVVNE